MARVEAEGWLFPIDEMYSKGEHKVEREKKAPHNRGYKKKEDGSLRFWMRLYPEPKRKI